MGHKGIIMQETRDTFKIINTQNAVKSMFYQLFTPSLHFECIYIIVAWIQ